MVVGQTGAGKSTLANRILDHPEYDIFEERIGRQGSVTGTTQRGTWGDLVVIDTPGVPASDTAGSLRNFDAIVEHIRRERTLSTLIFLVHEEPSDGSLQLAEARILLEQLNHLPCSKLIVCRQPELTSRTKRAEEEKRERGVQVAEMALGDTRLSMPMILLTDGYTEESSQQVAEIIAFVRRSERVAVDVPSLRTSDELRQFLYELADTNTRLQALKHETQEMESSLWYRTLWMTSHLVPLAYMSATSSGLGSLRTGAYVKREQEEGNRIRSEISVRHEELERGEVDEEQLRVARERLGDLDNLYGY